MTSEGWNFRSVFGSWLSQLFNFVSEEDLWSKYSAFPFLLDGNERHLMITERAKPAVFFKITEKIYIGMSGPA